MKKGLTMGEFIVAMLVILAGSYFLGGIFIRHFCK